MTYVGPYSQATLISQPDLPAPIEVATPGTLLDYIGRTAPHFLQIVRKANMLPFYNTVSLKNYTVFLPLCDPTCNQPLDSNFARRICQKSTVPGIITADMLSSSGHLVLYSIYNGDNEINVTSDENGILTLWDGPVNNGHVPTAAVVLYSDIRCTNGLVHVIDKMMC